MNQHTLTLTLMPGHRTVVCRDGERLATALASQGVFLRTDCGGKAVCGKCRVTLYPESIPHVSPAGAGEKGPHRLACRTRVHGNVTLTVPPGAAMTATQVTKPPALLPACYTPTDDAMERDDLGVAVDLGTTTIALYLLSLSQNTLIGSLAVKNPQALFGADVMARIGAAEKGKDGVDKLRGLAIQAIGWGVEALLNPCGLPPGHLKRLVAVGNSTMVHILAGVNPGPLGVAPYAPVFVAPRTFRVEDSLAPKMDWGTLPLLSGFLGSDILAAALAVDLAHAPTGTLLVDIGTNGEIMLKGEAGIFAASCATGPAFEGGALSCGMPAVEGAIDSVSIHPKTWAPSVTHIGEASHGVTGICGSGIIQALSEMLRNGLVHSDGRFATRTALGRLQTDASGYACYTLSPGNPAGGEPGVHITQKDIRALQLAKAALMAGIELLARHAGIPAPTNVLLAGAFGNVLREGDTLTLGMLPEACRGKIRFVGNAAGAGAIMALCHAENTEALARLANETRVINLGEDKAFNTLFINALGFPHIKKEPTRLPCDHKL